MGIFCFTFRHNSCERAYVRESSKKICGCGREAVRFVGIKRFKPSQGKEEKRAEERQEEEGQNAKEKHMGHGGMTKMKKKLEGKETNKMRVGAWNCEEASSKGGWQYWKWRCKREWWTKRKWKVALLSEVHGKGKKGEETAWGDTRWTVICNEKLAVAMNADWAARWRKGGSKIPKSSDGRRIAVDLPPK